MEPITIGLGVFVFSVSSYITVWLSQATNANRTTTNDDILNESKTTGRDDTINESLASTNDTTTSEDNYSVIVLGGESNID